MEMGHFWSVPASLQLFINLFIGLSRFLLPFVAHIVNIRGSLLRGILFTRLSSLCTFIFSVTDVIFNSFNTSVFALSEISGSLKNLKPKK
jgi:hypothetical protein